MDDAAAGPPQSDPGARGRGLEEVVDLAVLSVREPQVSVCTLGSTDEMVAVDRRGDLDPVLASGHPLQPRHERAAVGQREAIRIEVDVVLAAAQRAIEGP